MRVGEKYRKIKEKKQRERKINSFLEITKNKINEKMFTACHVRLHSTNIEPLCLRSASDVALGTFVHTVTYPFVAAVGVPWHHAFPKCLIFVECNAQHYLLYA